MGRFKGPARFPQQLWLFLTAPLAIPAAKPHRFSSNATNLQTRCFIDLKLPDVGGLGDLTFSTSNESAQREEDGSKCASIFPVSEGGLQERGSPYRRGTFYKGM